MPSAVNTGKMTEYRGKWTVAKFPVTAAQTFVVGDWVAMTDAGTISIAVAAGNDVASGTQLLGRALANAADVLALSGDFAECPVQIPAGPDAQFVAAITADDATANLSLAESGSANGLLPTYGLRHITGGSAWTVNESETTDKKVVIVERHRKYPVAEAFGWFWCAVHTDQNAVTAAT